MNMLALFLLLFLAASTVLAETESSVIQEPRLYDHYLALQQMQRTFFQRSPEEQDRLQPQMHGAERQACQRLRRERQERVPPDNYRRQGGDQFFAFVEQFEQYCQTLQ
jgi:hypothetical protein